MILKRFFVLLIVSGVLILVWAIRRNTNAATPIGRNISERLIHPSMFYDESSFREGVKQTKKADPRFSYRIAGGIVPHHLLPGSILTDFFYRLSKQNPRTIILIGPNHYEKGGYRVLTSAYHWDAPFGVVAPQQNIIEQLLSQKVVEIDEEVLPNDHAVAGLMPFIAYYLPETTVVPLLISGHTSQKEVEFLTDRLMAFMNKDTVLVAAVDFSHYLLNKQAQEKDERTISVIKSYDYRQLFTLNNDYLDSPPSIATLLMVMQKLGKTNMDILHHTNSGEMLHNDTVETTSYFSVAYY